MSKIADRVRATVHGKETPEYVAWKGMRYRCRNKSYRAYHRYGGRGIVVCDGWRNNYTDFYHAMGPKPTNKHTLDRIDNNGNYSCGSCGQCRKEGWGLNCRWVTQKIQLRNYSKNRILELNGQSMTIVEWAEKYNVNYDALLSRLEKGMPLEQALTTPFRKHRLPPIEFNGKSQTVVQWAKEYQIPRSMLHHRLKRGWSIEKAIMTPVSKPQMIAFCGEENTVRGWAIKYGMTRFALYGRLKSGWGIEDALLTPPGMPKGSRRE